MEIKANLSQSLVEVEAELGNMELRKQVLGWGFTDPYHVQQKLLHQIYVPIEFL